MSTRITSRHLPRVSHDRRFGTWKLVLALLLTSAPGRVAVAFGGEADALLLARTEYRVEAHPGELTCRATTVVEIVGAGRDRLTFRAPVALNVLDVSADQLAGWESRVTKGRRPVQILELRFERPIQGEHRIELLGALSSDPEGTATVPALAIEGADAHTGRVSIATSEEFSVVPEISDGARLAVDAGEADLAFEFWREDFDVQFTTRARRLDLSVDATTTLTAAIDAADLHAAADIRPSGKPLFELQLIVPAEWRVLQAQADGRPVDWYPGLAEAGRSLVRIPLVSPVPAGGSTRLVLEAERTLESEASDSEIADLSIPEIQFPQARRVTGRYAIVPDRTCRVEAIDLTGLSPVAADPPGASSAECPGPTCRGAVRRDLLVYEYDSEIGGVLRIESRPISTTLTPATEAQQLTAAQDKKLQAIPMPAYASREVQIVSEIGMNGRARHRARFDIPRRELTGLLIEMPSSGQLRSAFLDEKPVELRTAGERLVVPLGRSHVRTSSRTLTLEYATERAAIEGPGTWQETPPRVLAVTAAGVEVPLEPLEQNWSVRTPPGMHVFDTDAPFEATSPLPAASWLSAAWRGIASPARALWSAVLGTAVLLIVLVRPERSLLRAATGLILIVGVAGLLSAADSESARALRSNTVSDDPIYDGAIYRFQSAVAGSGAALNLRYTQRANAISLRVAAALATTVVLWPLRRRGRRVRTYLAAAGLGLPVAVLPVIEASWHPGLDGVVLGTLAAIPLWLLHARTGHRRQPVALAVRAACAAILCLGNGPDALAAEGPSGLNAESRTEIRIDDSGVRVHAEYEFPNCKPGSELIFALPHDGKVCRVGGLDLAAWRVDESDTSRGLAVKLKPEPASPCRIDVELWQPLALDAGTLEHELPLLTVIGAARESGAVCVILTDHLNAHFVAAQGLQRVDPDSLPIETGRDRPQLAFRRTGGSTRLVVAVERPMLSRAVTGWHEAKIDPDRLRMLSRFEIAHRHGAAMQFAAFIPEGYQVRDVQAGDLAEWSFQDGIATVVFSRPQSGTAAVTLELEALRDSQSDRAELAVPLPLEADRMESHLAVWVDEALQSSVSDDDLFGWAQSRDNFEPDGRMSAAKEPPLIVLANSSMEPLPVGIGLATRTTSVRTQSLVAITARDAEVEYGVMVRGTVHGPALRDLTFTVPQWLSNLTFDDSVQRVTKSDETDDRIRWTVRFRRPQRDGFTFSARATLPCREEVRISAPRIAFDGVSASSVEVIHDESYVSFANESPTGREFQAGFDESAIAELPLQLAGESDSPATIGFRLDPNAQEDITWTVQPESESALPGAVVCEVNLTAALEQDGNWRMQAHYEVLHRERCRLPLVMPAGVRLLAVVVNGEPVDPLQDAHGKSPDIFIPLQADGGEDEISSVKLLLAGTVAGGLSADIELTAPEIPTPEADSQHGLPVLRTNWNISVPSSLRADVVDQAQWRVRAAQLLAGFQTSREPVAVSQTGPDSRLVIRLSRPSRVPPAAALAGVLVLAAIWRIRRRNPAPPKPESRQGRPEPDAASIAVLPHQSGIFLPAVRNETNT